MKKDLKRLVKRISNLTPSTSNVEVFSELLDASLGIVIIRDAWNTDKRSIKKLLEELRIALSSKVREFQGNRVHLDCEIVIKYRALRYILTNCEGALTTDQRRHCNSVAMAFAAILYENKSTPNFELRRRVWKQ